MHLITAPAHSIRHRDLILRSTTCGYFYCLAHFPPSAIREWCDEEQTALCPNCAIDSVLGDGTGVPVDIDFLKQMHRRWFSGRNNEVEM